MTIRDQLSTESSGLTRSDMKVARAILSDYPSAGLGTVATLALVAGVSGPSVVRFVTRLGFDGFPAFQKALLAEVQTRMNSPLAMIEAGKGREGPDSQFREVLSAAAAMVEASLDRVPAAEAERAAALIADRHARIHCIGGRFSGYLAGMLWAHLRHLRPDVHMIEGSRADQIDSLVDFSKRDVIIAYDYRRYQLDVINFVSTAVAQGARLILFTDPYLSPLATQARVVFTAPVEGPSPFDTMVPALAQTEALIAAVTASLAGISHERIARIEKLRREAAITEPGYEPLSADALGKEKQ